MPENDETQTSVYVLVEGRKVMELEDPDVTPRNWDWLGRVPNHRPKHVQQAASCPRQIKALLAVEAGQYFEVILGNKRDGDISCRVYLDGNLIGRKLVETTGGFRDASLIVRGSSYDANARRTGSLQKMKFAPLAPRDPDAPAVVDLGAPLPETQQGRIDVVVYRVTEVREKQGRPISSRAMPSSAEAVTTGKKNVFGLGAAFDAPQRQKTTTVYHTEKDPTPLATYSFRYAAIEALHLSKTTPKVWLDGQTKEIDATRLRSREMRNALRAGYAITEPPTYLWTTELSPLGGAGAPRAVAATAELDSKLRSEGFKLCGEARGLFDALSHQLCGTHQLSA